MFQLVLIGGLFWFYSRMNQPLSALSPNTDAQQLRSILDFAACGVILYEAIRDEQQRITDFRLLTMNREAELMSGYVLDRVAGCTVRELFPNDSWETGLWANAIRAVETGAEQQEMAWLTSAQTGVRAYYHLTLRPALNGVAISVTDVTRIEAERELLANIIDHSPNGIIVYEAIRDAATGTIVDFRTVRYNALVEPFCGYTPADMEEKTLLERFSDGRHYIDRYRVLVETGEPFIGEYYFEKTGRWIENQARKLGDGYFSVLRDVTEQRLANQSLQEQQQLLDGVLTGSPNSLSVYQSIRDPETGQITDFRIVLTNQASLALMPRDIMPEPTRQIVEGQTHLTLFPHSEDNGTFRGLVQVVETGEPWRFAKDYPEYGMSLEYSTTKFGDGLIVGIVDITRLRQANDLIRAVLDGAQAGIIGYKAVRSSEGTVVDFKLTAANQAASQIVGLPVDELVGQSMLSLVSTNSILEVLNRYTGYADMLETGQKQHFETSYEGKGGRIWFDVTVVKQGDGIILTFLDVTDRKLAEQEIQKQSEQLKATLDASINSILAMTAIRNEQGAIVDFRMDTANGSVERSLGRKPHELEGRTLLDVYPGNVENGFFELYAKATDTGTPQQGTLYYTDSNGFEDWFEVSAVQQAVDKVVITFLNVSESKQNELKVKQQAELLQSVLNATLTAVATYRPVRDHQGRIVDFNVTLANQASAEMLGSPANELYNRPLSGQIPSVLDSASFDQFVSVMQRGEPITMQQQIGERWYVTSAVRFSQEELLTSSIDITETKLAHEQIEQMNARLKRSNESLDQFASVASHDLQEPLRKIKTFGDLLLSQHGAALGDGKDLLERMQAAAGRMQSLIRDLLMYSRVSQSGDVAYKQLDLNRVVGEVLIDLELAVADKGAEVEVAKLPVLMGDPLQVRQVFQNLLSNALKFTKPGRQSRIRVQCDRVGVRELPPEALNQIRLPAREYYMLSITDNGIGFSETYRERIFGAFERLHGKSSPYGGTGIGLAIVRRVMENHNGAVTAHGVENEGATFALYFPATN